MLHKLTPRVRELLFALGVLGGLCADGAVALAASSTCSASCKIVIPGSAWTDGSAVHTVIGQTISVPASTVTQTTPTTGGQPVNTAVPALSGTPTLPNNMTVSNGNWSGCGTGGCTYTYQWQDCYSGTCINSQSVGSQTSILGLGPGEDGTQVQAIVTATSGGGQSATATSTPSATVTANDGLPAPLYFDSAWTTPIGPNPTIAPNNSTEIADGWASELSGDGGNPGFTGGDVPTIWPATAGVTPEVTVELDYPSCDSSRITVPIPSGAMETTYGVEGHMTVLETGTDPTYGTDQEFDYYKMSVPGAIPFQSGCAPDRNWHAEAMVHESWTQSGANPCCGVDGAETPAAIGPVLQRDAQDTPVGGNWGHALAYSAATNCARSESWCGYAQPGSQNDGTGSRSTVDTPEGVRIQLGPSVDCRTNSNGTGAQVGDESATGVTHSEIEAQMCRTLQIYGAYSVDSNDIGAVFFEQGTQSLTGGYDFSSGWYGLLPISEVPASDYRYLAWTPHP